MRARSKFSYLIAGIGVLLMFYFGMYLACVQREEFMFDSQFRSLVPKGSMHRVAGYRYINDSHFVVTRIFQPAHAIDVFIRPHYWSKPDNQ